MARTSKAAEEEQWAKAQRRCRLSDEALRMAKELGLNPTSLIKNIPSPKQQWKVPVEEWVHGMYRRRYGSAAPPGKATDRSDDGPNGSGQPRSLTPDTRRPVPGHSQGTRSGTTSHWCAARSLLVVTGGSGRCSSPGAIRIPLPSAADSCGINRRLARTWLTPVAGSARQNNETVAEQFRRRGNSDPAPIGQLRDGR
jgi:hypothetical protein